jgi:hypothetical protein
LPDAKVREGARDDPARIDQLLAMPSKVARQDYWMVSLRGQPSLLRELNQRL